MDSSETYVKSSKQEGCRECLIMYSREHSFKCVVCTFECVNKDHITIHIKSRSHKRTAIGIDMHFKCFCGYKTPLKYSFVRHVHIHSNEKQFTCNMCDYRCIQKSTLDDHMNAHSGAKLFECNICGKCFGQSSHLYHHKLVHTDEKNVECSFCDYKCARNSSLKVHMKTHPF